MTGIFAFIDAAHTIVCVMAYTSMVLWIFAIVTVLKNKHKKK